MKLPAHLDAVCERHQYSLIFATISGAHLYGFPSPDSDYDLRGVHALPIDSVIGLDDSEETIELSRRENGIDLDLVTHDIKKFMKLMLKPNGYVLEQLYSPLVVRTSAAHDELKQLGSRCITKLHSKHYLGFALGQWKLFQKEEPPRVKPLLYVYRVLLTGINLMRTGRIEANLLTLNQEFNLPYISELIELKVANSERQVLNAADVEFHAQQVRRLESVLQESADSTMLPRNPTAKADLNDLLKRIRRGG